MLLAGKTLFNCTLGGFTNPKWRWLTIHSDFNSGKETILAIFQFSGYPRVIFIEQNTSTHSEFFLATEMRNLNWEYVKGESMRPATCELRDELRCERARQLSGEGGLSY